RVMCLFGFFLNSNFHHRGDSSTAIRWSRGIVTSQVPSLSSRCHVKVCSFHSLLLLCRSRRRCEQSNTQVEHRVGGNVAFHTLWVPHDSHQQPDPILVRLCIDRVELRERQSRPEFPLNPREPFEAATAPRHSPEFG